MDSENLDYDDLDIDLQISEEEEFGEHEMKFIAVPMNEDDLLADHGDENENGDITEPGIDNDSSPIVNDAEVQDTSSSGNGKQQSYWIDPQPEKVAKNQEQSASVSNANANQQASLTPVPSSSRACASDSQSIENVAAMNNEKRDLVEYGDVDLDVGEIPPEGMEGESENNKPSTYFKGQTFDMDEPFSGRRKFKLDPRETSLDEIIRQKERERRNRDESSINRQPRRGGKYEGGRGHQNSEQNKEKLRQGLRAMVEEAGIQAGKTEENGGNAETSTEVTPPKWTQDPWSCISFLTNRGYSISWATSKLIDDENVPEELANRVYKCVVSYNNIIGKSEAPHMRGAKQGAAADFLKKFVEHFPTHWGKYSYPTEIDETLTIYPNIVQVLVDKLKENYPEARVEVHLKNSVNRRSNGLIIHSTVLTVGSENYEASSTISPKSAKLKAAKKAYEDLLGEPCPESKIFRGQECTTPDSLYRGVESEITHCYDFSRVTMLESGNFRQAMGRNNYGMGPHRNGRRVMVSYEQPEN